MRFGTSLFRRSTPVRDPLCRRYRAIHVTKKRRSAESAEFRVASSAIVARPLSRASRDAAPENGWEKNGRGRGRGETEPAGKWGRAEHGHGAERSGGDTRRRQNRTPRKIGTRVRERIAAASRGWGREGGGRKQRGEEARGTGPNWHDSRKGKKNRRPQKVGRSGDPPPLPALPILPPFIHPVAGGFVKCSLNESGASAGPAFDALVVLTANEQLPKSSVKTIARKRENKKWKRAVLQSTRGVPGEGAGEGLVRDGWEKRGEGRRV